jgi:hypothetical protein
MERTLAIDEAAYGADHPDVATDLNNLAQILWDLGDVAGARPLQERALAIREAAAAQAGGSDGRKMSVGSGDHVPVPSTSRATASAAARCASVRAQKSCAGSVKCCERAPVARPDDLGPLRGQDRPLADIPPRGTAGGG